MGKEKRIFLLVAGMVVIFFCVEEGRCFYPDTVDPRQVRSVMQMQKESSKNELEKMEQEKKAPPSARQQFSSSEEAAPFIPQIAEPEKAVTPAVRSAPQTVSVSRDFKNFQKESREPDAPQKFKMPPAAAAPEPIRDVPAPLWPGLSLLFIVIAAGTFWLKRG